MIRHHWILDENGSPIECDLLTWIKWFEERPDRVLKQEWVGETWVSTIFLGLDHNFVGEGPPILWETMTFSNRKQLDMFSDRCPGNKEQAEAMHRKMVRHVAEIEGISEMR